MEGIPKQMKPSGSQSAGAGAWMYIALAFACSWIAWILAIKLHTREEFLNFGTAGPALAAIILSRNRQPGPSRSVLCRILIFCVLLVFCWVVLSLHDSWRGSADLRFGVNPWLLGPAILPAWIISAVLSKDGGVRSLLRRLVHPPNRWLAFALLFYPAIQIIPAFIAHLFHLPLVNPGRHGPVSVAVAASTVFFLYNLLFVGVLEEPGWRGFLLDRLQEKLSPLAVSMAVWLPWALWHGPLDFYRPVRFSLVMYLELRVAFLIPIAIIFTWLYNRSGRSIQACAMFHAGMNTFPFVLPYFAPGFALLFIMAIYGVVADRMWRKRRNHAELSETSAEAV
jgi:membrane protease YdiL (CAAX protease family)